MCPSFAVGIEFEHPNIHATKLVGTPRGALREKQKEITDHANPEENEPQRSKEWGRRGSTGPPNQSSGPRSTTGTI